MDDTNVNGGNAEVPREDSNLNVSIDGGSGGDGVVLPSDTTPTIPVEAQHPSGKESPSEGGNAEAQEVNGDLKSTFKKRPVSPSSRKKQLKFKANFASTLESDVEMGETRLNKRKLTEVDDGSSDDSLGFSGFDLQVISEMRSSNILKKLIAEAEIAETQRAKRTRYSKRKFETIEKKEDDNDLDDMKAFIYATDNLGKTLNRAKDRNIYETESHLNLSKIKKEKESDKSETDSIDVANSIDSEVEPSKTELSSIKSTNSSVTSSPSAASPKVRGRGRIPRIDSPTTGKQKPAVDMSSPLYKEPFKYGWKRELVFRASNDSSLKRMADIYYYTPKGKKVRSFREVAESLHSKELTIENFTFFKEPIGLDDPEKEIIRDAKKWRGSAGSAGRKPFGKKKPGRKPLVQQPVASTSTSTSTSATVPAPVATPAPTPAPAPAPVSAPVFTKAASKSPKAATSPGYKTKGAVKKTPQIKMKPPETKPPIEETDMLPPRGATRRNQQTTVEKVTPVKSKRVLTPKVQEPCSIRCSTSMGLIPSLQCRVCLCLYHPECVEGVDFAGNDEYVCKNCQQDTKESHTSNNPSLTPPPLIPISMLGAQNVKAKHPANLILPKLQRIPKSEGVDAQTRSPSRVAKVSSASPNLPTSVDKRDSGWYPQTENEFLQSHDGTVPKPAQNIAVIGGKKYIVVPKNNAMAVQPAITVKPDMIGDKPPALQDGSLIDISNTVDSSVAKLRAPPAKHPDVEVGPNSLEFEKAKITADKEPAKDDTEARLTDLVSAIGAVDINETLENKDPAREADGGSIENASDNESSTANADRAPESEGVQVSRESPESEEVHASRGSPESEGVQASHRSPESEGMRTSHRSPESEGVQASHRSPESEGMQASHRSPESEGMRASHNRSPESDGVRASRKSPESEPVTPVHIASVPSAPETASAETIDTDRQQPSSSNAGTVTVKSRIYNDMCELKHKNLRKQNQQETEQQQHFMGSVCAGYHALLRIFQYLKVQELLRAARVCKMWRDLAAHPSLWKTVRMKNSQVTDWVGLADTLQRRGTQHLDLRKMLVSGESDGIWKRFLSVIPRVTSLVKLELCRCPVMVVEEVIKSCPQLEVLSAMSIKCDSLTLESVGNLKRCQELRLKAISGMSLQQDLTPLQELTQLTQLSLTSVKELGKKKIDVIQALVNLETLELGECSDFPDKFGTTVLIKLNKLERLRLEKGQGSCCTFDILEGVSKLENLNQMELVNFDVKNGFDKCLANCKNIKRLLIIPTYISQSATSNNMVLGGVTELSNNLTHFVWGVTLELLRVTELFVDQCNLMSKQVTGDSIPVLKPVPCLKLIDDAEDENENQRGDDKQQQHLTSPQVDILPLPQLQKLLLTALPKTRVKILKIPFHATWRQSISDTTTQ